MKDGIGEFRYLVVLILGKDKSIAFRRVRLQLRFLNHQNVKKFGPVLVKLQALYTERCIWDYAISIQSE